MQKNGIAPFGLSLLRTRDCIWPHNVERRRPGTDAPWEDGEENWSPCCQPGTGRRQASIIRVKATGAWPELSFDGVGTSYIRLLAPLLPPLHFNFWSVR
jgi:hypothetical protein